MKYMGSKARLAKSLVPIIQRYVDESRFNTYYEPFCGGCNVIDKIKAQTRIASDIHPYLIALLKQAQKDVSVFPETYDEDFYKEVKNNIEKYPEWLVGLVGFATFGAKWMGGYPRDKKGNRDIVAESIRNIKKQATSLKDIIFNCCSFEELNIYNSVIYNDIPYKNSTKYANHFDYDKFYDWCRKQKNNGNIVLCSEYEMPLDFECIWEKSYSVNFDSNRRTKQERIEKLFILP